MIFKSDSNPAVAGLESSDIANPATAGLESSDIANPATAGLELPTQLQLGWEKVWPTP